MCSSFLPGQVNVNLFFPMGLWRLSSREEASEEFHSMQGFLNYY